MKRIILLLTLAIFTTVNVAQAGWLTKKRIIGLGMLLVGGYGLSTSQTKTEYTTEEFDRTETSRYNQLKQVQKNTTVITNIANVTDTNTIVGESSENYVYGTDNYTYIYNIREYKKDYYKSVKRTEKKTNQTAQTLSLAGIAAGIYFILPEKYQFIDLSMNKDRADLKLTKRF